MYLVYCKTDGQIFREVENYRKVEGQLEAGFNGAYTLIYPDAINADVIEISQEQLKALGNDYSKYLVQNGSIVDNPNWVDPDADKKKIESLESQVTDLQMALAEVYEMALS